MCGVYFFTKNSGIKPNDAKTILNHRGPDDSLQINLDDSVIGFNLLTIRDNLINSKQPVLSKNKRFILTFNGEIYNTKFLIEKFDLKIKSQSDTEILIRLIDQIQLNFINYINGMFSIIVYDKLTAKVHLFRDTTGQKSLYYYYHKKILITSSEIKLILKSEKVVKEINKDSYDEFFSIGYNSTENTIFKNIKKIQPGQKITIDLKNNNLIKEQYKPYKLSIQNKNIYDAIDETVKNHLLSNEKIGINISGGLDSNIILHHAAKYKSDLTLFSNYFENCSHEFNQDFERAKQVADLYKLKLVKMNISQNDYVNNFYDSFSNIEEVNRNFNNPIYYQSYQYQKKENCKVILTGDGGDEIFAGYDWYRKGRISEKLFKIFFFTPFKQFSSMSNFFNNYERYKINNKNVNLVKDSKFLISKSFFRNLYFDFRKFSDQNLNKSVLNDWHKMKMVYDQYFWLSSEVFVRADKLSMQNSIEIRNPFADYQLRSNLFNNLNKNNFSSEINKFQIRNIYKDKLPKVISNNIVKQGYKGPNDWMENKNIKKMILDLIPNYDTEYLNFKTFKEKLSSNKISMKNRSLMPLFSLLILADYNKLKF